MQIYDYECDSETYKSFAPTETFDGFLNHNSRIPNRLEDFACVLVIETSCESSARLMRSMNIKISGDTVIHLLLKRYSVQPVKTCGSVIRIDDFVFKKRHTYGTLLMEKPMGPWPYWKDETAQR